MCRRHVLPIALVSSVQPSNHSPCSFFFFFNDTATTEISTLPLPDALPIWSRRCLARTVGTTARSARRVAPAARPPPATRQDRKSTRLNSSHLVTSYAVFCLKKKKKQSNLSEQLQ